MVEWRKNWSTTATFICEWYLQVKGNVGAWLKTNRGILETETVLWCFISAASESSAGKIGGFARVKWSHGDMLLVSASIFSGALRLIIGLQEWVRCSSLSCWMDALMVACWKAGMSETGSKSHSECHMSPKGKKKTTWGHQTRTEWVIWVHTILQLLVHLDSNSLHALVYYLKADFCLWTSVPLYLAKNLLSQTDLELCTSVPV